MSRTPGFVDFIFASPFAVGSGCVDKKSSRKEGCSIARQCMPSQIDQVPCHKPIPQTRLAHVILASESISAGTDSWNLLMVSSNGPISHLQCSPYSLYERICSEILTCLVKPRTVCTSPVHSRCSREFAVSTRDVIGRSKGGETTCWIVVMKPSTNGMPFVCGETDGGCYSGRISFICVLPCPVSIR